MGMAGFSGATRGTYFSNIDLELVDGEMFPLTSEQFEKYIVEKKIASMYPEISTGVRVQAIRRLDSLCSELQMEETEDGVKYSLKGIENLKQEEKIRRIVEKINYYSRDWALSDGFVSGGKVNTEEEKGKPEFLWIRPAVWLKLNVQDK